MQTGNFDLGGVHRLDDARGEGDARAAEIYASAYSQDPEFYAFYRSIDAYRNSVGKSGDILVLDPNNEFFRYLNRSSGGQQR